MLRRDGRQRISLGRDCRLSSERISGALTRGLLADDLVVATGQLKLRAGQRVKIDNSIDLSRPVTGP